MRFPFALRLHNRRGLLVYQLVLILIAIVILILVLLFIARRNQIGTTAPATAPDTTASVQSVEHPPLARAAARLNT
ncbi:MAG TPA: hypothetical protein VFR95_11100 [Gemmatimonadaceae bacterium]|nr:hypothetical protein [Gemmatimonadaceae bacterium]